MPQEYQIPNGDYYADTQKPINDELEEIYRSQAETPDYNQLQAERAVSSISKRLFGIAGNIAQARAYRLDSQFFTHAEKQNNFTRAVAKKLFNRDMPLSRMEPLTEDRLKKEESKIGAGIFGAPKPNEHIEFFNDNRENWFFYQSLTDSNGAVHSVTLHYEVHPVGVLRISSRNDTRNEFIKDQESENFLSATEMYHDRVMSQMYNRDLYAGKKAA